MGIIIIIVILVIAFLIWSNMKAKEKQKEKERATFEKLQKSHEDFERLCKSELVQLLHERMHAEFDQYMRWQVNYYLNTHKIKPENINAFIYADKWVNDDSAIWASRYSDEYQSVGNKIRFQELGYQNLSHTHQGQLKYALEKYSKAWTIKCCYNKEDELVYNEEYWYPYIQSYIDKQCKEKNIKAIKDLKTI